MSLPPTTGTKESRLTIARERVAFWTIWSDEAVTAVAKAYFRSRKNHWQHAANAIELEP